MFNQLSERSENESSPEIPPEVESRRAIDITRAASISSFRVDNVHVEGGAGLILLHVDEISNVSETRPSHTTTSQSTSQSSGGSRIYHGLRLGFSDQEL